MSPRMLRVSQTRGCLEGGLVGERRTAAGPRVLGVAARTLAAAVAAATAAAVGAATAAPTEATAAGTLAAGDLGRGVAQRRADLVDLHLHDGALLALTGLVGALHEATLHDDAGALGQRLGHVLGGLTPDGATHEQRVAVLPLVALTVELPRRGGHGEVRDRGTRRREPQLGVGGQVPHDGDDGVACHTRLLRRVVVSGRRDG